MEISHYDLCKKTAEKFLRDSWIVLYEYQSYATDEFPDVLRFKNGCTWLYEIKVSKQDFKNDSKKECRREKRIKYNPMFIYNHRQQKIKGVNWKEIGMNEFISEAPHLGRRRYYVCPSGLIQPDEVENGWGLYWFTGKNFTLKKESGMFKANIYDEMKILEHAFRKYADGVTDNILVHKYKK